MLCRTADGHKAEVLEVLPGKQPLWGLLHGCGSWQSVAPNARSLQVVSLAAGPKLFCWTQVCEGGSANWTKPARGGQTLWQTDGTPGKAHKFWHRTSREERWPGRFNVLAIDDNNSRVGSLVGISYAGKLFFSKGNKLHISDKDGLTHKPFTLGGLSLIHI